MQCILVTSRPVLFYALKQRLEGSAGSQSRPMSSTMKGLIQVCIDSATQIVSILAQLKQHDLLGKELVGEAHSTDSDAYRTGDQIFSFHLT